jgi:hypothetical protein
LHAGPVLRNRPSHTEPAAAASIIPLKLEVNEYLNRGGDWRAMWSQGAPEILPDDVLLEEQKKLTIQDVLDWSNSTGNIEGCMNMFALYNIKAVYKKIILPLMSLRCSGSMDVLTIGNNEDWVDFEEQEINDNRRQELSTQTFWKAQSKETLASVYKSAFPGVEEVKSSKIINHTTYKTKTAYITVISKYLKQDGNKERINVQAAIGVDGNGSDTLSSKRKDVILAFVTNSVSYTEDEP